LELMPVERFDIVAGKAHYFNVRTTLTLDDEVFELAARQAKARGLSLGKTISHLARRGLQAPTPARKEGGLVVFDLPADSPKVSTEDVRRLESEGA
jgi:hypothetical protein